MPQQPVAQPPEPAQLPLVIDTVNRVDVAPEEDAVTIDTTIVLKRKRAPRKKVSFSTSLFSTQPSEHEAIDCDKLLEKHPMASADDPNFVNGSVRLCGGLDETFYPMDLTLRLLFSIQQRDGPDSVNVALLCASKLIRSGLVKQLYSRMFTYACEMLIQSYPLAFDTITRVWSLFQSIVQTLTSPAYTVRSEEACVLTLNIVKCFAESATLVKRSRFVPDAATCAIQWAEDLCHQHPLFVDFRGTPSLSEPIQRDKHGSVIADAPGIVNRLHKKYKKIGIMAILEEHKRMIYECFRSDYNRNPFGIPPKSSGIEHEDNDNDEEGDDEEEEDDDYEQAYDIDNDEDYADEDDSSYRRSTKKPTKKEMRITIKRLAKVAHDKQEQRILQSKCLSSELKSMLAWTHIIYLAMYRNSTRRELITATLHKMLNDIQTIGINVNNVNNNIDAEDNDTNTSKRRFVPLVAQCIKQLLDVDAQGSQRLRLFTAMMMMSMPSTFNWSFIPHESVSSAPSVLSDTNPSFESKPITADDTFFTKICNPSDSDRKRFVEMCTNIDARRSITIPTWIRSDYRTRDGLEAAKYYRHKYILTNRESSSQPKKTSSRTSYREHARDWRRTLWTASDTRGQRSIVNMWNDTELRKSHDYACRFDNQTDPVQYSIQESRRIDDACAGYNPFSLDAETWKVTVFRNGSADYDVRHVTTKDMCREHWIRWIGPALGIDTSADNEFDTRLRKRNRQRKSLSSSTSSSSSSLRSKSKTSKKLTTLQLYDFADDDDDDDAGNSRGNAGDDDDNVGERKTKSKASKSSKKIPETKKQKLPVKNRPLKKAPVKKASSTTATSATSIDKARYRVEVHHAFDQNQCTPIQCKTRMSTDVLRDMQRTSMFASIPLNKGSITLDLENANQLVPLRKKTGVRLAGGFAWRGPFKCKLASSSNSATRSRKKAKVVMDAEEQYFISDLLSRYEKRTQLAGMVGVNVPNIQFQSSECPPGVWIRFDQLATTPELDWQFSHQLYPNRASKTTIRLIDRISQGLVIGTDVPVDIWNSHVHLTVELSLLMLYCVVCRIQFSMDNFIIQLLEVHDLSSSSSSSSSSTTTISPLITSAVITPLSSVPSISTSSDPLPPSREPVYAGRFLWSRSRLFLLGLDNDRSTFPRSVTTAEWYDLVFDHKLNNQTRNKLTKAFKQYNTQVVDAAYTLLSKLSELQKRKSSGTINNDDNDDDNDQTSSLLFKTVFINAKDIQNGYRFISALQRL